MVRLDEIYQKFVTLFRNLQNDPKHPIQLFQSLVKQMFPDLEVEILSGGELRPTRMVLEKIRTRDSQGRRSGTEYITKPDGYIPGDIHIRA
ncbi:MAG: hypothetical protein ACFFD4_35920, partial [Candidatus Odinarchaeota archaeon]